MPDKIEQIMKNIHVLFAKCEEYNGSPDKIIISKKEMFDILEELNTAIYDVLDKYEATKRSKEKAKLEMERIGSEIISQAKKSAEDVNAASLLYTDTMLEEIRSILEETKKSTALQLEALSTKLNERIDLIVENKEEVKDKLSELHENEFYLKALSEKRNKDKELLASTLRDIDDIEGDEDEEESGEQTIKRAEYVIKVNEAYLNKSASSNNNGNQKNSKQDSKNTNKQSIKSRANKNQDAKSIEEELLADDDSLLDLADEIAPFNYGAPRINPDDYDLDGEYYRWMEEQEGNSQEPPANTKKQKRFGFGRKK